MGLRAHPLASRDRRDSVDRRIVLLHASRRILRKQAKDDPALAGTSWQVHGGGFYEMRKYLLAPASLPEDLIWHKWQSYWTWMSGFVLLCWVYYGQSSFS